MKSTLILPQLATAVSKPPQGEEWIHEPKLDGYRLIAVKNGEEVRLYTRNQHDWTHRFKSIAKAISQLPIKSLTIDGELIVINEKGLPDFQYLQNSLLGDVKGVFQYYIFDLMSLDNLDIRALPLIKRKKKLERVLKKVKEQNLKFLDYFIEDGALLFKKAKKLGLEGIVSKRINSPYISGRSKYWVKTKCKFSSEFLVCGYSKSSDANRQFGSLFLAKKARNNKLKYCGNVGTGFDYKKLEILFNKFEQFKISYCPFDKRPTDSKSAQWLQPKILVEVEYSGITQDKILRHPSFKGLREEKL